MYLSSSVASNIPIIASLGALSVITFLVLVTRPKWALSALFLSLLVGQTLRIPLTDQGGGILLSDIALLLGISSMLVSVLLGMFSWDVVKRAFTSYCMLVLPFFLYSLALLLLREQALGFHSFSIAFLYWARLFAISLVFPIMLVFGTRESNASLLRRSFVATYYGLILLGYIQLFLFPSLVGNVNGWDPHIHRMVSTWFDPNFFGAFIALGMFPAVYWSKLKLPVFLFSCGALLLTGSRSSWIAFVVACGVTCFLVLCTVSLQKAWRNAIPVVLIACVICVVIIVGLFPHRVATLFTHDPTVALRAHAYKEVWHRMVEPNILFGVGYNAYQFSAKKAGLIEDFTIHSRAGSDNSIFTLLVTTGIIGTLLFLLPLFSGFSWHAAQWVVRHRNESLLFIWAVSVLLVHAQFENSLLYPHLLIPFLIISAISLV